MRLFGTDGIRGEAGQPPLDAATVVRVGAALARSASHAPRVVIGRDTRESGPDIESALARGIVAAGGAVNRLGVVPTPAVAYLARSDGFDLGVVISASHNPYHDNGIKVFSGAGEKFSPEQEREIERLVADPAFAVHAPADVPTAAGEPLVAHYVDHLRRILDSAGPLTGSTIVVDCANGATAAVAPPIFRALGFDVRAIGVTPDGRNINAGCGSTAMESLQAEVLATGARLGVAFDGDGDRALFVDHLGRRVDGDAVMLICADLLRSGGALAGDAIVATVMSNIGLELALRTRGVGMVRCPVGDKYVMEELLKRGLALGGEQSGHVIFAEHLFTGDGIATALYVVRALVATGKELAGLAAGMTAYPQVLVNVRVKTRTDVAAVPEVARAMKDVELRLAGQGRLLVRYSGTEPLLRIMLEGQDQAEITTWANEIADAVRATLA
ncbi:MAG: phosphoglucosamine mutase [Vicinamibacterales bacterium]